MKDIIVSSISNSKNHGFIPLPRNFIEHPFWNEPRKLSRAEAFLDLLFSARYGKDPVKIYYIGEEIIIKHGMIITSIVKLSHKWGRSDRWVKRMLLILREEELLLLNIIRNKRIEIKILYESPFFIKATTPNQDKSRTDYVTKAEQKPNRSGHNNTETQANKEIITTSSKDDGSLRGNSDINFLFMYLKEKLNLPLLDESEKTNRRYCWLSLKKFGGIEKMKILIDSAAKNQFWKTNVTSFKQLYYKAVQIISSTRGGEKYGQYKTG